MVLIFIYLAIMMLGCAVRFFLKSRKRIIVYRPALWILLGSIAAVSVFLFMAVLDPRMMNEKYGSGLGLILLLIELFFVLSSPIFMFLLGRATTVWMVHNIERDDLYDCIIEVLSRNGLEHREVEVTDPVEKDMKKEVALVDHDASVMVGGVLTTYHHGFHIRNSENFPGYKTMIADLLNTIRAREFSDIANLKPFYIIMIGMAVLTALFYLFVLSR
jgi:hypothetical protein